LNEDVGLVDVEAFGVCALADDESKALLQPNLQAMTILV